MHSEVPAGYELNAAGLIVPSHKILGHGHYRGEIVRAGETIDTFEFDNLVVNQGLNYLLGAALAAQTVVTSWYIGLFSGNYTVLAADTAATIAANATEVSAYTAAARQLWVPAVPASQSATNSASQATFTFNAGVTIYGAFLLSSATISGASGTLFSGAQFGAAKAVVAGDQLLLTYTYTAASA